MAKGKIEMRRGRGAKFGDKTAGGRDAKFRDEAAGGRGAKFGDEGLETRGREKIEGALKKLRVNFRGKIVLDIGSSTGGFTEAALVRGAKKVIAVEKGTGQMRGELRSDERVELHEKTDIFKFELDYGERPEVVVADVSFVSLTKVLAYAKNKLTRSDTEFFCMLKPQFEAKGWQLERGVVKNNKIRREIIDNFERWLRVEGFLVLGKCDNELKGRHGNVERFYWLRLIG